MKILITGACGWLARHLVTKLESSHELRLLDRVDPKEATIFLPGKTERMLMPMTSKWPYVRAEITDLEAMRSACENIDAVIHLAAATTGLPQHGKMIMEANVIGTYVLLDAARQNQVKRFLCASSINAFGTFYWRISGKPPVYTQLPLDEEFHPVPEDPYSLSKLMNETTCEAFHRAYGITTAAFRFAGVYNEELYQITLANRNPTKEWQDDLYQWVHVEDIVEGLKKAMECPTLPGYGFYTLGAPDTTCPESSMDILKKFRPDLEHKLKRPLKGREAFLSIEKAKNAFGFDPKFRFS